MGRSRPEPALATARLGPSFILTSAREKASIFRDGGRWSPSRLEGARWPLEKQRRICGRPRPDTHMLYRCGVSLRHGAAGQCRASLAGSLSCPGWIRADRSSVMERLASPGARYRGAWSHAGAVSMRLARTASRQQGVDPVDFNRRSPIVSGPVEMSTQARSGPAELGGLRSVVAQALTFYLFYF